MCWSPKCHVMICVRLIILYDILWYNNRTSVDQSLLSCVFGIRFLGESLVCILRDIISGIKELNWVLVYPQLLDLFIRMIFTVRWGQDAGQITRSKILGSWFMRSLSSCPCTSQYDSNHLYQMYVIQWELEYSNNVQEAFIRLYKPLESTFAKTACVVKNVAIIP